MAREVAQQPLVLLVEDDPQDALIVQELLEESGLAVRLEWARSVDEARRELARLRPDDAATADLRALLGNLG